MFTRTHRTARTFVAFWTASLALLVGSFLSAGPVSAQVLPPEVVPPSTVHDGANLGRSGGAAWPTYVLVACVAVAVGVALGYALLRVRTVRLPAPATTNTVDQ